MATPYLCEASGARILTVGTGITQIGDNYQLDLTTWDVAPMGEVGDCLFRTIDVAGTMTNGLALGITPSIDGVDLDEQTFSLSGSGQWECQAFIAQRGTRISARIRTLSRTGDVTIHNIMTAYVPLRREP